jgi:hypothetical protein
MARKRGPHDGRLGKLRRSAINIRRPNQRVAEPDPRDGDHRRTHPNLTWALSGFPPSSNPVIDGTNTIYAVLLLLLMFLHAGRYWGLGRWWESHTPAWLH